ncbi:hypothetical protein [Methanococcus aeolicus]|uniref:Uncharacterized protein n=1 Tax=Methanococcus aeolicus (strain ATCC BAA-1280 / DSM 17508 / OCM 812 / Nankai-3) TaxID=419665 RepID=A6UVL8_META3|nr:hypothetical protein [Methanococcus aeolicus]ABR56540.1 conserved hypothetical protein [Methanococcus aeolicus Nankai-3]UXM84546.1 hypothetical protein N6C89_07350 [Methanococcus aeolicus]
MEHLKENVVKIISNKMKLSIIAKLCSIEQYNNELLNDFSKVQMEDAELLYEKYIIYYNEKPTININNDGDIVEVLNETIDMEKQFAKKIGANFGIRQATIHCLADDEKFYYYLTK